MSNLIDRLYQYIHDIRVEWGAECVNSVLYEAISALSQQSVDSQKLRTALGLAKDMMLSNGLDLPNTMEVINEALGEVAHPNLGEQSGK